jgi:hypothetical protein
MLLTLAALAVACPQGPGPSPAPVVINEFSYDDDGVDDFEFVELYNTTGAPIDISGWVLQGEELGPGGAANQSFTFPGAPGSMTTVINPGQFLLVSNPSVPNHNPLYVMPLNFLENGGGTTAPGSDGLTLRDALGNVIDAIAWEYAGAGTFPTWIEGNGLQGGYLLNQGLGLNPATPQRWLDGWDTNNNGADFVVMGWTPGAPNGSLNTAVPPIVENFDAFAGTPITNLFSSSFVSPTTADPMNVVTSGGFIWSPGPSPQGGNIAAMHDITGGGNTHVGRTFVSTDMLIETYVYMSAGNAVIGAQEGEAWAIGAGTTDAYGHPTNVPGNYYTNLLCNIGNGPGSTGIAWYCFQRLSGTELYLVDLGAGGTGFTVLGGPINITAGVNDGWQRLRLRVAGSNVLGNFGGTYGVDDGQRITATVTPRLFGQAYLAYRECILSNPNMRPLVIDRLEIYPTVDTAVTLAGTGSPTFVGTPNIGTSGGLPTVGNAAFQYNASSLIPGGISIVALDLAPLLPGLPVPGTQPALLLYAFPTTTVTVFNTPGGTGTLPLPIPGTNSLIGTTISTQWFDLDITLPFALPFGSSRGCQIVIGNG